MSGSEQSIKKTGENATTSQNYKCIYTLTQVPSLRNTLKGISTQEQSEAHAHTFSVARLIWVKDGKQVHVSIRREPSECTQVNCAMKDYHLPYHMNKQSLCTHRKSS